MAPSNDTVNVTTINATDRRVVRPVRKKVIGPPLTGGHPAIPGAGSTTRASPQKRTTSTERVDISPYPSETVKVPSASSELGNDRS
jgi:hypothetical protein